MKIFSIRNRLILLTFIVIVGIGIQNAFATESTNALLQLELQRRDYENADTIVLNAVFNFENIVSEFSLSQIERFLVETLFQYNLEIQSNVALMASMNVALSQLKSNLQTRNAGNYEMKIENIGQILSFLGYSSTPFPELTTIIDTGTTGAFGIVNNNGSRLLETAVELNNVAGDFKQKYREIATEYIELSSPIGSWNSGIMGNLTNQFVTLKENLNVTNYTSNYTYSVDMLSKFSDLEVSIEEVVNAWAVVQVTGFGINATDAAFIENKRVAFHASVFSSEDAFQLAMVVVNQTANIRNEEQIILDEIVQLMNGQFYPAIHQIAFNLDDLYTLTLDLKNYIENDLKTLNSGFNDLFSTINTILTSERSIFFFKYTDFRNQLISDIRSNSNTLFLTISLITALIVLLIVPNMILTFRRLTTKFTNVSKGDLSFTVRKRYARTELGELESLFDEVVQQLRGALSTIGITSERLSGIAEELAAGSEEASSSIKEVSDTMREFSGGASEQNIMLSRVNEKLNAHLLDVEQSSARIGETSNFVLKVAKRTNILGLNASIEAAKAGRYGRGFNVVAEEVRNLSDTTKSSANKIVQTIEDVQYSISSAVEDILREVNIVKEVAENTAAGSEEVSAATMEQVTMLGEISETTADLANLASDLNTLIQRFKL